jgi:protein-L-isoaspartate(D-aspartate) O-methyltransferase
MLLVTRFDGDEFSARFLCGAAFYEFSGARDPEVSGRLEQAIARDRGAGVKSLRRDHHPKRIRAGCMATFGALSCR